MSQHPDPTEIVLLLIQYGANPDIPSDIKGKEASALGIAAEGGNTEITETLLKMGVDPNAFLNRFILIATLESNQIEISRLLVDYGADLNFYANDEALSTVAQNRSIEGVGLLLNNGISAEQIEVFKKWITAELGTIEPKTKDHTKLVEIQGLLINAKKSSGK